MVNNLEVFTSQQQTVLSYIDKGKSITDGSGYSGTAPSYPELSVDITELASAVFKSSDIYRPNTNIGYKEMFDTVVAHNRFSDSIGNTRASYYTMGATELETLRNLHSYTQNVINKLITVPS